MRKYNVVIVGATGNVGREFLSILYERSFPVKEVYAVASRFSAGKTVVFGNKKLTVIDIEEFDFAKADIALFGAGSDVAKKYAKKAGKKGCVVIDNSSYFRMDKDIPLIIPEVNKEAIKDYKNHNVIANPNCSTIQMLLSLKPLHQQAKIKRVVVATYQSVSGAGKKAMDELYNQTKKTFLNEKQKPETFTKQIAFNVIPHIDVFMEDGSTKEEWKMREETKKILDKNVEVIATCVRCPIFVSHAEAINVEFEKEISVAKAIKLLENAEGVILSDERKDGGYITPIEATREDEVFISRLRKDPSTKNALAFWCVSDNVRKGAALNAIQIAEELITILQD